MTGMQSVPAADVCRNRQVPFPKYAGFARHGLARGSEQCPDDLAVIGAVNDDGFVVYIREEASRGDPASEVPLAVCASYEEAGWVRRENQRPGRRCVIRYVGPAGGGD